MIKNLNGVVCLLFMILEGKVELKYVQQINYIANFRKPRESNKYYAVVSASVGDNENSVPINVEIPISQSYYDSLKKELLESSKTVGSPRLRIKGNLEIILDDIAIN